MSLSSVGLVTLLSSQVHASGYRVEFQSPSVLADGGDAAVIDDASTNWYNSAGLVKLPQQLIFSGMDVYAPTTFSGNVVAPSSVAAFVPAVASNFAGSGRASSHPNIQIPAFHYSLPLPFIKEGFAFGFSVAPSWGFDENYGQQSLVRYNLTRIYTKTITLTPSLAMKVNDYLSLGVGPDFEYFSVSSRTNVRTQGLPGTGIGTAGDSIQRFSADSWNYGAHIGFLYQFNEATRIGLNYRTQVIMDLDGYSDFGLNGGGHFETNKFSIKVPMPPSTALSIYHDINPQWGVMGTIIYDQWSIVNDYHAKNIVQPPTPTNPAGMLTDVILQQNMRNAFDFSAGAHYKINDQWMLRGSLKYEETPTVSQFRYVYFPDGDKLGVNVGAHYQVNKQLALDALYAHVFVRTVTIHDVNPITAATATGRNRTAVDVFGGQIVWNV